MFYLRCILVILSEASLFSIFAGKKQYVALAFLKDTDSVVGLQLPLHPCCRHMIWMPLFVSCPAAVACLTRVRAICRYVFVST